MERAFAQDVLHQQFRRLDLSRRDRNLLTEIVLGVVRHRLTLDSIIEVFSSRPAGRTDARIVDILRIAAYQIVFLDRIPASAAVNTAVQSTKRRPDTARAGGFVNGVLRSLCRCVKETREYPPAPAERCRAIPLPDGRWQIMNRPVLPDPGDDLGAYVAAAYSHPPWLVRRWLARYGKEETTRLCASNNRSPCIYLRPNRLRTTPDELVARLTEEGLRAEIGSNWIALHSHVAIEDIPGFDEGHFQVQDPTAVATVEMLRAAPGHVVADLCAAPGGKATHLCELMNNEGIVIGLDLSLDRLRRTRENARRLGATALRFVCADAAQGKVPLCGPFDRVLVDVPCSNTGVLARRADARWRVGPKSMKRLAAQQRALLVAGLDLLAADGLAVYSTCSIEPEENNRLVQSVLQERGDFVIDNETHFLPHRGPGDGGYAVVIRRRQPYE